MGVDPGMLRSILAASCLFYLPSSQQLGNRAKIVKGVSTHKMIVIFDGTMEEVRIVS